MPDLAKKIYQTEFIILFFILIYGMCLLSGIKILDHYLFHKEEINEFVPEQETHLDHALASNFAFNDALLSFNGSFHRIMGHKEMNGIIKLENDYLLFPFPSADPAVLESNSSKMSELDQYAKAKNIYLIYVPAPYVLDRDNPLLPLGVNNSGNDDLDQWISLLRQKDVDTIDFREEFSKHNIDHYSMFYRTDHHWTIPAGFFAFCVISNRIDQKLECQTDPAVKDYASYTVTSFPDKHLGSAGQRVSAAYAGIDDFELVQPDFPTFLIKDDVSGSFQELVIDMSALNSNDITSRYTYDTTYQRSRNHFINPNAENDLKILVVGDSYATAVDPWLILAYHEVMTVDANPSYQLINEYDPNVILFLYYPKDAFDPEYYNW